MIEVGPTSEPGNDAADHLSPAAAGSTTTLPEIPYDSRILHCLRRIVRSIELHSKHLSVNNHITAPQLVCLLAVVQQGAMSATAIGREVHLSASTVVGILDRLEEKGWITRTREQKDRRVVMVAATETGAALARRAPSPLQRRLADSLRALSELERMTIALSLERVASLMEKQVIGQASLLNAGLDLPPPI